MCPCAGGGLNPDVYVYVYVNLKYNNKAHSLLYLPSMSNPYNERLGAAGQANDEEQQLINSLQYADSERAMELMGITPTTFSNNIQFQVPRFLQDGFDPAYASASASVPTAPYSLNPSSTQPLSNPVQTIPHGSMGYPGCV